MNSEPIKSTEVKDKRLLKATPMERKKLLFGDNSYNEYVAGVGLSLQRDCRVRVRYYWAGLKALPCRIYSGAPAREARQRSTMGKKIW